MQTVLALVSMVALSRGMRMVRLLLELSIRTITRDLVLCMLVVAILLSIMLSRIKIGRELNYMIY